jgi:predicted NodU family carbamoyl transferase
MSTSHFTLPAGGLILALNPGHDGAVVVLKNRSLLLSYEAEQDSHPRHMPTTAYLLLNVIGELDDVPAVVATSGWSQDETYYQSTSAPYYGIDDDVVKVRPSMLFGHRTLLFESTHERSHIFCSYGMSPFDQGEPCYVLVWEGEIGSFYEVDERMRICQHGPVVSFPGYKYSFLFDLADPSSGAGSWRLDTAGKLMALAGFSKKAGPTFEEQRVITRILQDVSPRVNDKKLFKDSRYLNCGVTDPAFRQLVGRFSDALFDVFYSYARAHLKKGFPLLVAGGCGLNCEWNSKWRDCGLFSDVFVPPVTNDSGSAIGTAIEAQYVLSNCAKISWTVYSGLEFDWDGNMEGFVETALDYEHIADLLAQEKVIAWVQGRSEIGPRALGNRSLLASPLKRANKDRLNSIKGREWYRPIAPVCLEEDSQCLFGVDGGSPFMLYFQMSRNPQLEAVSHVDGSARVQTVSSQQNPPLYKLLTAFKRRTGFGVLCNTSLNRKGMGFINRSRDLFAFANEKGIDAIVIGARTYLPVGSTAIPRLSEA